MTKYAVILCTMAVAATAPAISLQFTGSGPAGSGTVKFFGTDKSVGQGILNFNVAPSGTLKAVCADLGSTIDGNFHEYTPVLKGLGATNIDKAARIVAAHFGAATDATKAAGLQLAVWEALYDGGANFDGDNGNFQLVGGSSALADATAFYTAINTVAESVYYGSSENGAQSQFAPVPEPASLAVIGMGLAAFVRRRKGSK